VEEGLIKFDLDGLALCPTKKATKGSYVDPKKEGIRLMQDT